MEELKLKLQEFINNPELIKEMGVRAKIFALEKFSSEG